MIYTKSLKVLMLHQLLLNSEVCFSKRFRHNFRVQTSTFKTRKFLFLLQHFYVNGKAGLINIRSEHNILLVAPSSYYILWPVYSDGYFHHLWLYLDFRCVNALNSEHSFRMG